MRISSPFLLAVMLVLLAACTERQNQELYDNEFGTCELSFDAKLCEAVVSPQTKTSVVRNGDEIVNVLWSPGDDINVFRITGNSISKGRFINNSSVPSASTVFSGSMAVSSNNSGNSPKEPFYWAVYPFSEDNVCTGAEMIFSVPAVQKSPSGTFASGQWPTMALSQGMNLNFYSVCSGVKFKVAHEGVTSVTFKNRDGGAINGTITSGWDKNDRPYIKEIKGTDSVVVTPADSDTFEVGALYFVVLPVVTMTEGVEVTYMTSESYCKYVNGNSIPFLRNTFNTLYLKDLEYEDIPHTSFYEVTNTTVGQSYLIVSNGYALKNDAGKLVAESVENINGEIEIADVTDLLWTAGDPYQTSDANYGGMTFYCNSEYLYRSDTSLSLRSSASDKFSNFAYNLHPGVSGAHCLQSGSSFYAYCGGDDGVWNIGPSSESTTVSLYSSDRPKQEQELSFDTSTVFWDLDGAYHENGSYAPQTVNGAHTSVCYSSSNTSVAVVSGSQLIIKGAGITTITAIAAENEYYCPSSSSYTLIVKTVSEYNIENTYVSNYLDKAEDQYTDTNWKTVSIVKNYSSNSAANRKDIPAPVKISWGSGSGSGKYEISVYNESSCTDPYISFTTSSSSADIYNLVPGRTYYYTVKRESALVDGGMFSTTGRCRMLKVSDSYAIGHANNCRDLGGLTTTDGKTLKYGLVYRGTNMDATTSVEKEFIANYMNVGLDIDLRNGKTTSFGESGSSYAYDPFKGQLGVSYICGYFEGGDEFLTSNTTTGEKMSNIFAGILTAISAGKAAYIHCRIGADRTGYLCMLLEAALGVSPKDCSIDFELTSFSNAGDRLRTGVGNSSGLSTYAYINGYDKGSTFKEKAYNILLDYGITAEQISRFRELMLE